MRQIPHLFRHRFDSGMAAFESYMGRKTSYEIVKKVRLKYTHLKSRAQDGLTMLTFHKNESLSYLKALFTEGRRRLTKLIEWVKSKRSKLRMLALRFNLRWYAFFVANCILAFAATSFGFALGALLTILVYDDGLERVMDVYNYFKRPPRS